MYIKLTTDDLNISIRIGQSYKRLTLTSQDSYVINIHTRNHTS